MQPEMRLGSGAHPSPHGEPQLTAFARPAWSGATKIAFRFAFVYFGLVNLATALFLLAFPPFTYISRLHENLVWKTVVWVSHHILHLQHDFGTDYLNTAYGNKDTVFAYVQVLCYLVIAIAATLVWSLWDRKRREYVWLHTWFLAYLRICLASALIPYGAAKIFAMQFPPPTPSQLVQPLGSFSTRDILWLSMGASARYSFFGGLMEVVAGLLLVVPQWATLGALMATAVMTNVLMLNIGYDISVKLMSLNLVLMGVVIFLPDVPRLADFFVFQRSVPAVPKKLLFRRRSLNWAALVLQIAFGLVLLSYDLVRSHQLAAQYAAMERTPLFGSWLVDDYVVNDRPITPLTNDPHRWQRLVVDNSDSATVQVMTGATSPLNARFNASSNSFALTQPGNPNWIAEFAYDNSKPGALVLTGKMGGLPMLIRLHREDESKFPLSNHDFHWITGVQF